MSVIIVSAIIPHFFIFEKFFNKDVKESTIFLKFTLRYFTGEVICYISI